MSTPLAQPAFRWFLAGRLISLLGTSMAPIALAFAVLDAFGGPSDLGLVLAARMVPLLAFLLVGGAVADRFSRRAVLVLANLGAGLTQAIVAALLLTGRAELASIAGLEFLNGLLAAFSTPALRGAVPYLVDNTQLRQANSLIGSTRNATKILGPSLAGVVVVTAGSGAAIALDAVSYLLAAGCLSRLALPAAPRERRNLLADIAVGWQQFRRWRWIWTVSLAYCALNLVNTGTWQILGPSLTEQLSGRASWGLVLSARGLGLLVMSMLMYRVVVRHLLRLGQLAGVLGALPLLALGLHSHAPVLIGCSFVAGLGASVSGIGWETTLAEHVEPRYLSRVSSIDDLLSYLAIPIGQLAVGPLTRAIGGFTVAGLAGISYVLAAAAPLAVRSVRRLPHVPADDHTAPAGSIT